MILTWPWVKPVNKNHFHPLFLNRVLKPSAVNQLSLTLVKMLHSSDDPRNLLELFKSQVSRYLPLSGLSFQGQHEHYCVAFSEPGQWGGERTIVESGEKLGALNYQFSRKLNAAQQTLFNEMTKLLALPLKNALKLHELRNIAFQDQLTQLGNRHIFETHFATKLATGFKFDTGFHLIICDLDGFKLVNDKFGHQAGDLVLQHFANVLRSTPCEQKHLFRLGGDEFAILHQVDSRQEVETLLDSLLSTIQRDALLNRFNVSCSIGVTQYKQGDSRDSMFLRADKALYLAKSDGKNCYRKR